MLVEVEIEVVGNCDDLSQTSTLKIVKHPRAEPDVSLRGVYCPLEIHYAAPSHDSIFWQVPADQNAIESVRRFRRHPLAPGERSFVGRN